MPTEPPSHGVRADRWLWATRVFKTRAEAAQACRVQQVRVGGQPIKPSRILRVDDVLEVEKGPVTRTLQVRGLAERRVGASVAAGLLDDLTPPEVWARAREARAQMRTNRVYRGGAEGGRPRKRDRRLMEAFEGQGAGTVDGDDLDEQPDAESAEADGQAESSPDGARGKGPKVVTVSDGEAGDADEDGGERHR